MEKLVLTDYDGVFLKATSEKVEDTTNYKSANLFDGNYKSAWIEDSESKETQSIYVSVPTPCNTINIINGYAKNKNSYNKYSRAKRIRVTCHAGINPMGYASESAIVFMLKTYPEEFYINLTDIDTIQTFSVPFEALELKHFKDEATAHYAEESDNQIYQVAMVFQLEIIERYDGGSNNVSLSEIFFNDSYVADYRQQKFNSIKNIYVDEKDEGKLLIDSDNEKRVAIIGNSDYVHQIAEMSKDKKWVTIIRMPANVDDGRVSTEYLIVNTLLGKIMNHKIEKATGINIHSPLFLEEEHGDSFLVHSDGKIRLR
ncbi:MAG: NADase-type glycan-binding domain-containing protein [Bacteroidales bacterium]